MKGIDIFLLAVICVSLVWGLNRGLIRQLASLGGVILGLLACRLIGASTGPALMSLAPDTFHNATAASIVGNVALFAAVYLTVTVVARMIHKLSHTLHIGWADHLLGAAFCTFKVLLVVSLALNIWLIIQPTSTLASDSTLMDGRLMAMMLDFGKNLLNCTA